MKFVIIESPYGSRPDGSRCTPEEIERNVKYARRAMRDCFERGEIPFASHLLYTQCFDDATSEERAKGMQAGISVALAFGCAEKLRDREAWTSLGVYASAAVYVDHGVTKGMLEGLKQHGLTPELRSIGAEPPTVKGKKEVFDAEKARAEIDTLRDQVAAWQPIVRRATQYCNATACGGVTLAVMYLADLRLVCDRLDPKFVPVGTSA